MTEHEQAVTQADGVDRDAQMARFVEYRRTGDRELRNEIVGEHTRLAEFLARRFAHRGEHLDDLRRLRRYKKIHVICDNAGFL